MNATRVSATAVVRRLWQFCSVLRDDGLSYPDYVEQLTYMLFLKLADESKPALVAPKLSWSSLVSLPTPELHRHYQEILTTLGQATGTLGLIFGSATNKIADPAKLRHLIVDLIGQTEWSGLSDDLKGDAYEGLLEKNARDTKSGAGQYFTPRPLIDAIVTCVAPKPGEVILDPACGTAGFLLAAQRHILDRNPQMTRSQNEHLRTRALRGVELVQEVARLATMNLFLHGVHGESADELPIRCADSLAEPEPAAPVDVVLTNPPFGIRGTMTFTPAASANGDELTVTRPDFWVRTANKQLNFLQHVAVTLSPGGRAALVLPDNVLFESGAAAKIRRRLLDHYDVHTLLRLPPGLFYATGMSANVMFFDRAFSETRRIWVYDLRSGNKFSLRSRPIGSEDLVEFVELFSAQDRGARDPDPKGSRWRSYGYDLLDEESRLDLSWEAAEASGSAAVGLDRIDELGAEIARDLENALRHLKEATRHP
jgi:type I restriction enzyme M protein